MTRTKRAKSKSPPKDISDGSKADDLPVRWYNPQPDNADVEWLENNLVDSMADAFSMFESLSSGEGLSCKLDVKAGRWMAILFGVAVPAEGHTPAMSVRGATAADALLLLGYFVVRKFPLWYEKVDVEHTSRFGDGVR